MMHIAQFKHKSLIAKPNISGENPCFSTSMLYDIQIKFILYYIFFSYNKWDQTQNYDTKYIIHCKIVNGF